VSNKEGEQNNTPRKKKKADRTLRRQYSKVRKGGQPLNKPQKEAEGTKQSGKVVVMAHMGEVSNGDSEKIPKPPKST